VVAPNPWISRRVIAYAHQGGAWEYPSSTLYAMHRALETGATAIELDVHATADGVVVVLHDATLDRTTDGTGPVHLLALAAVERLDAGYRFRAPDGTYPYRDRGVRVPTLAAVLEAFPGVPLNIEIKQLEPAIETAVLATLDRFAARERTLLAAEDATIMARIRASAPYVLTGFSAAEVAEFIFGLRDGTLAGYRPPGVALQVPPAFQGTAIVTAESVAAAHALNLEVHAWTINDEVEMGHLLDLDVDGLMTDFPARGVAVLQRRGLR
jgi:glycerophosphoryl diester phosphodiesterase